MVEITKVKREENNWDLKQRYGIESYRVNSRNPEERTTLECKEITISSRDEFIKLSIKIGEDNQKSLMMSELLNFQFYTEKRIVLL